LTIPALLIDVENRDHLLRAIEFLNIAMPDQSVWSGDAQMSYEIRLQEVIWQLYSELHGL